jgi:hypothetical protein
LDGASLIVVQPREQVTPAARRNETMDYGLPPPPAPARHSPVTVVEQQRPAAVHAKPAVPQAVPVGAGVSVHVPDAEHDSSSHSSMTVGQSAFVRHSTQICAAEQ